MQKAYIRGVSPIGDPNNEWIPGQEVQIKRFMSGQGGITNAIMKMPKGRTPQALDETDPSYHLWSGDPVVGGLDRPFTIRVMSDEKIVIEGTSGQLWIHYLEV